MSTAHVLEVLHVAAKHDAVARAPGTDTELGAQVAAAMRKRVGAFATASVAAPPDNGPSEVAGAPVDMVAVRHHLETLILKLASAQAGSVAAIKESRRHAEEILHRLSDSREPACDHARLAGLHETDDAWECAGCGARWPKRDGARPPAGSAQLPSGTRWTTPRP